MNDKRQTLVPGYTYHIFNRANGHDLLFTQERNYSFFLNKYRTYLHPFFDTYAYCLLDNHFHFLIRVKDKKEVESYVKSRIFLKGAPSAVDKELEIILQLQMQRFFGSYAKAFNKQEKRHGNLLERPFKRLLVDNDEYLKYLVYYIHYNPEKHKLVYDFKQWPWSSYQTYLSEKPTKICREKILEIFENKINFELYHHEMHTWKKEYGEIIIDI